MGWREAIGALLPAEQRPPSRRARSQQPPRCDDPSLDGPPGPPERAWSGKVFDQIEWRRFEAVCEALFAQSGMRAEANRTAPMAAWTSGSGPPTATSR